MDEASRREGAKFEGTVATLRADPRKICHYVEFTIDENDRMFMRSPRELISQRGLHDATDVVHREICTMNASIQRAGHPRIVISENPEFSYKCGVRMSTVVYACLIATSSPIINFNLSHLTAGHSTSVQQWWILSWFLLGGVAGIFSTLFTQPLSFLAAVYALFSALAIGGFVMVAQTMMSYGRCVEIGEASS